MDATERALLAGALASVTAKAPNYAIPARRVFTATTAWTVPANVSYIVATVAGGGGAGGTAYINATTGYAGAWGGCGGVVQRVGFNVTPGTVLNVAVGAGGVSTNNYLVNGGQGQASSVVLSVSPFTLYVACAGGLGGLSGIAAQQTYAQSASQATVTGSALGGPGGNNNVTNGQQGAPGVFGLGGGGGGGSFGGPAQWVATGVDGGGWGGLYVWSSPTGGAPNTGGGGGGGCGYNGYANGANGGSGYVQFDYQTLRTG